LDGKRLKVELMGRGFVWLDTGTHEFFLVASHFVEALEKRIGLKVACPEKIAYHQEWITKQERIKQGEKLSNNQYGLYLLSIANR